MIDINYLKSRLDELDYIKDNCFGIVEELQCKIENLTFLNLDLQEKLESTNTKLTGFESKYEGSKFKLSELQSKLEANINLQTDLQKTISSLSHDLNKAKFFENNIKQLEKEANILKKNIAELNDKIKYQEETIKLSKIEMDKLRAAKVSDEHMARQLLKLIEEKNEINIKCGEYENKIAQSREIIASLQKENKELDILEKWFRKRKKDINKEKQEDKCTHGNGFCEIHQGTCGKHKYLEPDGKCSCTTCPPNNIIYE